MTETLRIVLTENYQNWRLDKTLCAVWPAFSRSRLAQLIREGAVTVDNHPAHDPAQRAKTGQEITLSVPAATPATLTAETIPLTVVFEDEHLLIIDKPPGMTVHPAPGARSGTLVHALLAHCGASLSGIGGVERPGIVHRLDKDTSGLIAVAKHDAAHRALSAQLADRTLSRVYLAVVWGVPRPAHGTLTGNIGRSPRDRKKMAVLARGGRAATTHYRVLETFGETCSLVEATLDTGRTHQIRVHFAHAGHPLLGDPVYGARRLPKDAPEYARAFPRQALHATRIGFRHPVTGVTLAFAADPPEDFRSLLAHFQAKN